MKHITFKTIKIDNFLSIGSTTLELKLDNKINVITGVNYDKEDSKNGVGKSTITDAIHFALYGSTIREITKEQTVNSLTGKGCKVELVIEVSNGVSSDEYVLQRSISPTKFTLFKNGINITLSTIAKTNEFIQNILTCSSRVFQNSVVMSINNTVPFLAQSKVDKRKYIENILQLEVFSQMLLKAREEYQETKHQYDITRTKHMSVVSSLETIKKQIDIFETEKEKSINEFKQRILHKEDVVAKLTEQLKRVSTITIDEVDFTKEYSVLNQKIKEIENTEKELNSKKTQIETEKRLLDKQMKHLLDSSKPCPTCKRSFDVDSNCTHLIDDIKTSLSKLNCDSIDADIVKAEKLLTKLKTAHQGLREKEKSQQQAKNDIINNLNVLKTKIESAQEEITDLKEKLSTKQLLNNDSLLQLSDDTELKLQEITDTVSQQESAMKTLECVKYILSEEGVKTYLIKKILKVLNNKLNYYLLQLQAPVRCEFDEFFDEHIKDEKNNERSYFNFSGGERKRIDLACLFAFMDMKRLQGETVFNTTFYDELLDSSLDDKGVELVLEVLKQRNKAFNEGSYLITHRGQSLLNQVDRIIQLEKRNGFTYLLKD